MKKYTPHAKVYWFTGLSGAGKTTIAKALVQSLEGHEREVEFLDGDEIREIFPQTGFSKEDRHAHICRVGHLASRLSAHGVTVVASLVSPYEASRAFVRELCAGNFVEIYVSTPVEVCEKRDVKGLYKKARSTQQENFTGLTDPYEVPSNPDVIIDTTKTSVVDAVKIILEEQTLSGRKAA